MSEIDELAKKFQSSSMPTGQNQVQNIEDLSARFQQASTIPPQPTWAETGLDIAKSAAAAAPRTAAGMVIGGPGSVLQTATVDVPEIARQAGLSAMKGLDVISPEEREVRGAQPLYSDPEVQKGYREPFTGAPTYKAVTETFAPMATAAGAPSLAYKPKTGAGRVAEAGVEMGMQAVPGAIATLPERLAVGVAGGIGGQALAEGQGETSEPWARVVGTVLGGVAGHLGSKGIGNISNSIRAITSPTGITEERLANALALDVSRGQNAMNYDQIMDARNRGVPLTIVDIGGPEVRKLVQQAADTNPETRKYIAKYNQFLNDLQENVGDRIQSSVDLALGRQVNAPDLQSIIDQAGKAQRDQVFSLARSNPVANVIDHGRFSDLLNRPIFRDAMKEASEMGQNMPDFNIRPLVGTGDAAQMGNLNYWHQVKMQLQEIADRARNAGNNQLAAAAQDSKNKLVSQLTTLVPEYRNALDIAAESFNASSAPQAGYKFFDMANSFRRADLEKAMSQFTPEQRLSFADGFAQKIKDLAGEGKIGTVANRFLNNPDFETRALQVFGPDIYNQLKTSVATENLIKKTKELEFLKNNTTNLGRSMLKSGAITAGTSAALDTMFGLQALSFSPETIANLTLAAAGGGAGGALIGAVRNKAERAIANQIVPLALSQDPKKMEKIAALATKNPQVWQVFNKVTTGLTNLITAASKNPSQQQQQPEEGQAMGGRITRATGGRIGSAIMKADALIRKADQAKRNLSKATEPMLELPDEHVTKALAVAKAHI